MSEGAGKKFINDAENASKILECLSSPIRLMIICSLIEGEKNFGSLTSTIDTTKGNVSQHLTVLKKNGILQSRKVGNKVYYSIKNKKIVRLIREIKKICNEEKTTNKKRETSF